MFLIIDDRTLLKEMLRNIYQNIPYPLCERIVLKDKNGSNQLNDRSELQKGLTSTNYGKYL